MGLYVTPVSSASALGPFDRLMTNEMGNASSEPAGKKDKKQEKDTAKNYNQWKTGRDTIKSWI